MLVVSSHLGQTSSGLVVSHPVNLPREDCELPSPPVGRQKQQYSCENNSISRNRRLRCKCRVNVVLEHPGTPNRWLRGPQEHPKGSQESPKRHRGATKSTRSEAKRVPKSTQKEDKRAIESSKAKSVKKIPDVGGGNRAPA